MNPYAILSLVLASLASVLAVTAWEAHRNLKSAQESLGKALDAMDASDVRAAEALQQRDNMFNLYKQTLARPIVASMNPDGIAQLGQQIVEYLAATMNAPTQIEFIPKKPQEPNS